MEQNLRICQNCGALNRDQARFCHKCGNPIDRMDAAGNRLVIDPEITLKIQNLEFVSSNSTDALHEQAAPDKLDSLNTLRIQETLRTSAPTRLISSQIKPKDVGVAIGGYLVQAVIPLQRSNFYIVRHEHCPLGHLNSDIGSVKCSTCQAELGIFLVHENRSPGDTRTDSSRRQLIQISRSGIPGVQVHVSIFEEGRRVYTVCEHPGAGWQSLSQVALPVVDQRQIVRWCLGLGESMAALSKQGLIPDFNSISEYFETVIVDAAGESRFTDLTVFMNPERQTSIDQAEISSLFRQKLVIYLAQILYSLTSGKRQNLRRAPRDYSDVPAPFRVLVGHAARDEFDDFAAFVEAIRGLFQIPQSGRSLRQIAGYRTDAGKGRERNEDFIGKYSLGMQQTPETPEVGLYLVADGMGGRESGEQASRDVVRVILDEIQHRSVELQATHWLTRQTIQLDHSISPDEVLRKAIEQANEVLYNARQQKGSDRGATLTASLIVGETCAVANVGDSRTYLSRAGNFDQITKDHSLVASLVAARMIAPEEVRAHPQRSQIYRNLGERSSVQVDVFQFTLQAGDRLLLCSDGLWEMVLDGEIKHIVEQSVNPQETCDQLVDAANLSGGEDNISVITVWLA